MASNPADVRLFSIQGFVDGPPPWSKDDSNATKAKAVLLQRLYSDSDDGKRRLWVNIVIIFRALVHFSGLQFDRDFYKLVSDACQLASTNSTVIKDLAAYWSRRRAAFRNKYGRDDRDSNLLTELVDVWQSQFDRWRGGRLEYLPNVPRAIDTKQEEWADKIRSIDELLDPRRSPLHDSEPSRRHSSSPLAGRAPALDSNLGRKRSPSPKRESEGHTPLHSSKRRCTGPIGELKAGEMSPRTPVTPSYAAQIDSLITEVAKPSSYKHDMSSATNPTTAPLSHQAEICSEPTEKLYYERTANELFGSLKGRLESVEGKLTGLVSDHLPESFRSAQEDLAYSVQRLEDRLGSLKHETDDRLNAQKISCEQLEDKYARNNDSIATLKHKLGELESLMNDIKASSAVSTSSPSSSDALRVRPLSDFRNLYLEQPGLANLVLLTETFLNRIDSRCQDVDARMTRTEESSSRHPEIPATTDVRIGHLEEQVARLTQHASENEQLVKEQAEQIQQQNETIKELQTQQGAQLEEIQQQLNAVNLTIANHSSNMGLETRLITVLDLARVYHRREQFQTKQHMEHSARMVVSLEAAVNSLMNSKGK